MAVLIGAAVMAAPAHSAPYIGSNVLSNGPGRVDFTIVTDGTLGVLASENVTAFNFAFLNESSGQAASFDQTSGYFRTNSGLFATDTELNFDYDSGGFSVFQSADKTQVYCLTLCAADRYIASANSFENLATSGDLSGVQTIATVQDASPGAPAPVIGFGLLPALAAPGALGVTRRRRTPVIG